MERVSLARICAHGTHRERVSHAHTKPRTQFAWRIPSIPKNVRKCVLYTPSFFFFFFFNLYSFLFLSSPLFLLLLDALISICEIIHPVWMNYASTAQVDRTAMERFPRQYLRADFQPISKWFFFSFFLSLINGS